MQLLCTMSFPSLLALAKEPRSRPRRCAPEHILLLLRMPSKTHNFALYKTTSRSNLPMTAPNWTNLNKNQFIFTQQIVYTVDWETILVSNFPASHNLWTYQDYQTQIRGTIIHYLYIGLTPLPTYKTLSIYHWTTNHLIMRLYKSAIWRIRTVMTDWPQLYIPAIQIWYTKVYYPRVSLTLVIGDEETVYNQLGATHLRYQIAIKKLWRHTRFPSHVYFATENISRPMILPNKQYTYCTKNPTASSRWQRKTTRHHSCLHPCSDTLRRREQSNTRTTPYNNSYNVHIP